MNSDRLGIDLGGTKIEGVRIDAAGVILHRHRISTEQEGGYEHILSRIAEVISTIEDRPETLPLGIGTPGSLSARTGTLKNSNTLCLNGKPIVEDLEALLRRPIILENDANCFALAEARLGAGRDAQVLFGVILGTGVGGGIIIDGKIWRGRHHLAGEWGHHRISAEGPLCYCGSRGCIESILSGPAMSASYQAATGIHASAEKIVESAVAGNNAASDILSQWIENFSRALANIINILDPDAIVLGGGLSNIDEVYQRGPLTILPHIFNDELRTPILQHQLGDSAGVLGAALLAKPTTNG